MFNPGWRRKRLRHFLLMLMLVLGWVCLPPRTSLSQEKPAEAKSEKPAEAKSGTTDAGDVSDDAPDLGRVIAKVSIEQHDVRIYGPYKQSSPIGGIFDPACQILFARGALEEAVATGKLRFRVDLGDDRYREMIVLLLPPALNITDSRSLVRLPLLGCIFSLGPADVSEADYSWATAKVVGEEIDSMQGVDLTFSIPGSLNTVALLRQFLKESSLRLELLMRFKRVDEAESICRLEWRDDSFFKNNVTGPTTAGAGERFFEVAVVRDQIAQAVRENLLVVTVQSEKNQGGAAHELGPQEAMKLLPLLLERLDRRIVPWEKAMDLLSRFPFNGDDAGARITELFKYISEKLATDSEIKLDAQQEATASLLGIATAGGKISADYFKKDHLDRSSDCQFTVKGNVVVPASLTVATLHKTANKVLMEMRLRDTIVQDSVTRHRRIAVSLEPAPLPEIRRKPFEVTWLGQAAPGTPTQEILRLEPIELDRPVAAGATRLRVHVDMTIPSVGKDFAVHGTPEAFGPDGEAIPVTVNQPLDGQSISGGTINLARDYGFSIPEKRGLVRMNLKLDLPCAGGQYNATCVVAVTVYPER